MAAHDIHVTPLVEVFAVTVEGDNDDLLKGKCEVYGDISVIDELVDYTFHIYHRDKDNPESISFGEELLLTPPLDVEDAVIIPSNYARVIVELYDRARLDLCIAKGSITLDRTTSEDWLEDYQVKTILGEDNLNAKVHFAIFPYAVTATVRVLFFSNDDHFDPIKYDDYDNVDWHFESSDEQDVTSYDKDDCQTTAKLFGNVSAFAAVHGNDGKNPYRSSLLFRKPNEESVEVKSGKFIQLSRSVVAVPAYSSLKIKADFFYGDTQLPIASGIVVFKATDHCTYKKDIVGDNGARIRVQVAWSDAFDQLYRPEIFRPKSPEKNESITMERRSVCEGSWSDALDQLYRPEIFLPKTPERDESIMMEMLSVKSWSDAFDQLYESEYFCPNTPEKDESIKMEMLSVCEGSLTPEHPSSASALSANNTLSEDRCPEASSDNCTLSEDNFSETSETLSDDNSISPPGHFKDPLVEIFSVVVCSKDAKPFKFYGSVIAAYSNRYVIFRIRKSHPQDCPNSSMRAVVGDGGADGSFYMDGNLAILVDFKDISGATISEGYVSFRDIRKCGDKRMCSIIRGERGFAAVHYSIFPDGVSAAVNITLTDENCPGVVKGKIYARHVTCDESSRSHQQNLFKRLLFCDEHDGAPVYTPGVALPLVKSIISLPRCSYLIIEADVSISPDDDDHLGQDAKFVKGSVIFTGKEDSPKKICNDLYVSVKFSEASRWEIYED